MHPLIKELSAASPVVTDGAWATQLQTRGLPLGESAEAWNLSRPDQVEAVARSYVEAGSRIILTNTFGANRLALERHGLGAQMEDINRRGAAISKRAAGDRALVFASIGPSGQLLMMGEVSAQTLHEVFSEQARALAAGGAEALVVETMSDAEEAAIAIAAACETGLPVVGCMVFDSGQAQDRTIMGLTPEAAAQALNAAGASVIGANCGRGIAGFAGICRRLHAATDKPVWIKANAGLPEVVDGQVVYRTTAGEFADHVPELVTAGANFIGGCCGTGPEFIEAVAKVLAALHPGSAE